MVRGVDPERLHRARDVGVHGLEDRRPARRELARGEPQELEQRVRGQVLDELGREQSRHALVVEAAQVLERVGVLHLVAPSRGCAPPCPRRRPRPRRESRPPAAGRGTRPGRSRGRAPSRALEQRQVAALALAHEVLAAAEHVLEAGVGVLGARLILGVEGQDRLVVLVAAADQRVLRRGPCAGGLDQLPPGAPSRRRPARPSARSAAAGPTRSGGPRPAPRSARPGGTCRGASPGGPRRGRRPWRRRSRARRERVELELPLGALDRIPRVDGRRRGRAAAGRALGGEPLQARAGDPAHAIERQLLEQLRPARSARRAPSWSRYTCRISSAAWSRSGSAQWPSGG